MTDKIWRRDEIESPCVKLCSVHPETRTCIGCFRTIDEIGGWSAMTPQHRREVMADLPNRAAQMKVRRGGRTRRRQR